MRVILLIHLNRRTPTVAVLFIFTNCGMFGGGKKQGEAPWILLANGINSNTPSVDSPSTGGNRDPFAKLNSNDNKTRNAARRDTLIVMSVLNDTVFKDNPITIEQAVVFLAITKMMSPRPKSYSDKLSQQHDRYVLGAQLSEFPMQHMKADMNYMRGYMDGFRTGEIFRQPADIIIGFVGSFLLGEIDAPLNRIRAGLGAR